MKSFLDKRKMMIQSSNKMQNIKSFKIKDLSTKNKCFDYF